MREPSSPNGGKNVGSEAPSGASGVSIPDRRRIDSDVRAFLREPSTPWIVFDREGRPPSQLAVGEVLSVPRKSLLSFSDASFFPATAIVDATPSTRHEPSSLAVASDLESEDARAASAEDEVGGDASPIPVFRLGRRALGASAAALGVVAMLAVGALALRGAADGAPRNVAATQLASRSFGAAVPADIPPPELDVKASAAAPASVAPAAAAAAAPATQAAAPVKASAKKYGRLSITGDARSRDVFFDGKRLLGRGARGFTVMCGPHTVAVGTRTDVREVDIPCTGGAELVIGK